MRRVTAFAALALLTVAFPVRGADLNGDQAETVLVPVAFSAAQNLNGAYGTVWTGDLWAFNDSAADIRSLQPHPSCAPPCPPLLSPGEAKRISGITSNMNDGGALLHLPADLAGDVFVQSRMFELTRNSQPAGVEIPIVREGEFFERPVTLLGVPVSDSYRSALRVYDPRLGAQAETDLLVEILDAEGSRIGSVLLHPSYGPNGPEYGMAGIPHVPAVGRILDLTAAFPGLKSLQYFHVRVTPLTPGMWFWPMVSVTDNLTQHVLLITAD